MAGTAELASGNGGHGSHHRRSRAVGGLRLPHLGAPWPYRAACESASTARIGVPSGTPGRHATSAEPVGRTPRLRQDRPRNSEDGQEIALQAVRDVVEQGSRGVAGFAEMRADLRSAARSARSRRSRRGRPRAVSRRAGGRESSGSWAPRTWRPPATPVRPLDQVDGIRVQRFGAPVGAPSVLPADHRAERLTGACLPAHDRLPLGGQRKTDDLVHELASARQPATASSTLVPDPSASCSTQPGCGEVTPTGAEPAATDPTVGGRPETALVLRRALIDRHDHRRRPAAIGSYASSLCGWARLRSDPSLVDRS